MLTSLPYTPNAPSENPPTHENIIKIKHNWIKSDLVTAFFTTDILTFTPHTTLTYTLSLLHNTLTLLITT